MVPPNRPLSSAQHGREWKQISLELLLCSLLAVSFTLATHLSLWREQSVRLRTSTEKGILETLMGDSRRLFANHFFVKADAYLHGGVYPGIFDQTQPERRSHLSEAADAMPTAAEPQDHAETGRNTSPLTQTAHDDADEYSTSLHKSRDWIDAFGRNFFPTRHTHLEKADQREILPWLRLAAELNPNQIETYTVAAYWLRSEMGKTKEAEDFLRDGWRLNPESYEILFELGRLYEEDRHDATRACNLLELALAKWQQNEAHKAEPDDFAYMQITGHLARLSEKQGHFEKAISYLQMLRNVSPRPIQIQEQIDELRAKHPTPASTVEAKH